MQAAIISVIHNSGTLLTEEKFDSEPVLYSLSCKHKPQFPAIQYFVTVEVVYNMPSNFGKSEAEKLHSARENRSEHVTVRTEQDTTGNTDQDNAENTQQDTAGNDGNNKNRNTPDIGSTKISLMPNSENVEYHPIYNLNKSQNSSTETEMETGSR